MPDDNYGAQLTLRVPTNWKSALEKAAWAESTPHERTSGSDLVRDALEMWFVLHRDELPEEALDDLDDDLEANAGGDVSELLENIDAATVEEGAA